MEGMFSFLGNWLRNRGKWPSALQRENKLFSVDFRAALSVTNAGGANRFIFVFFFQGNEAADDMQIT